MKFQYSTNVMDETGQSSEYSKVQNVYPAAHQTPCQEIHLLTGAILTLGHISLIDRLSTLVVLMNCS